MSEFVPVSVPADRVLDVYAFLAQGEVEDAQKTDGDDGDGLSDEWTDDEIRRCYRESSPALKSFMWYLAERPGDVVLSTDLARIANYSNPQLRGAMGAFGKRVENRYKKSIWPFVKEWNHEVELMEYTMPERVAKLVRDEEAPS